MVPRGGILIGKKIRQARIRTEPSTQIGISFYQEGPKRHKTYGKQQGIFELYHIGNQMNKYVVLTLLTLWAVPSDAHEASVLPVSLGSEETNLVGAFRCSEFGVENPDEITIPSIVIFSRDEELLAVSMGYDKIDVEKTEFGYRLGTEGNEPFFLTKKSGNWLLYSAMPEELFQAACEDVSPLAEDLIEVLNPSVTSNEVKRLNREITILKEKNEWLLALAETTHNKANNNEKSGVNSALADALKDVSVAPLSPPLSIAERQSIVTQIASCWYDPPVPTPQGQGSAFVMFSLAKDGKLVPGSIRFNSIGSWSERDKRLIAEHTRRAIIRCQRGGFDLPPEKYDHWRDLEVSIPPKRPPNK